MLRLQSPLPERYSGATADELAAMIGTAKAALGARLFVLGPPLPARRGHALGRRPRRLLRALPYGRRGHRGRVHRLLRRALHGRVGRRPHRRPPAGDPARPQRRLLHGRHGRHRPGGGRLGGAGPGHRREPGRPHHLHELLGRPEGVRGAPRRRGVHLVERPGRADLGPRGRAGRQGPVLPRPASWAQHRLRARVRRRGHAGLEPPAGPGRSERSRGQGSRRCCCGRATAPSTSASGPSTWRRSVPSTPRGSSWCTPSAPTTWWRWPTWWVRPTT